MHARMHTRMYIFLIFTREIILQESTNHVVFGNFAEFSLPEVVSCTQGGWVKDPLYRVERRILEDIACYRLYSFVKTV